MSTRRCLPGWAARTNDGGNYCGHRVDAPRLVPLRPMNEGKAGHPRILTLLAERIRDYYASPRRLLPVLDLANGSQRQQRSERREACVSLLGVLTKFLDIASLRIGIPTRNGFVNLTIPLLARHAGLSQSRAERAMADLKASGVLSSVQPRLRHEQGYTGLAAVRVVSRHLFRAFGLSVALGRERKRATDRLRKLAQKWSKPNESKTLSQIVKFNMALPSTSPRPKRTTPPVSDAIAEHDQFEQRRRLTRLAIELKVANPDWSSEQCFEAARKIA